MRSLCLYCTCMTCCHSWSSFEILIKEALYLSIKKICIRKDRSVFTCINDSSQYSITDHIGEAGYGFLPTTTKPLDDINQSSGEGVFLHEAE